MKIPTLLCIHHSGVSHEKNADQFKANNEYHKAKFNFVSLSGFYLGYHYEIAANGYIAQARNDGERSAAAYQSWTRGLPPRYTGNMNDGRALHICIDGNFDIEKPTPSQVYALRDWLKAKCGQYKIPKGNIYFHRNFAQKTCPGMNMELGWIRNLIDK